MPSTTEKHSTTEADFTTRGLEQCYSSEPLSHESLLSRPQSTMNYQQSVWDVLPTLKLKAPAIKDEKRHLVLAYVEGMKVARATSRSSRRSPRTL